MRKGFTVVLIKVMLNLIKLAAAAILTVPTSFYTLLFMLPVCGVQLRVVILCYVTFVGPQSVTIIRQSLSQSYHT